MLIAQWLVVLLMLARFGGAVHRSSKVPANSEAVPSTITGSVFALAITVAILYYAGAFSMILK